MRRRTCAVVIAVIMWFPPGNMAVVAGTSGDVRWTDLPDTNTVFKPAEFASPDAWQQRCRWLREQVRFAAGLLPELPRTPLNARVFDRLDRGDYTIEKVCFESVPGFYVTGNLYRPKGADGKLPAVACPHGHWPAGRLNHEQRGSVPARCITLARLGAIAFSYDMIGYNDSRWQIDHRDKLLNCPASELWCFSSLGMQTWAGIRALDFLQSLPEVDPRRLGVTGASGGGTQTFILCAVDDRPKVAAPVNMISSTMQGGCMCENAALLRIGTDNMEIGALFAPRPLLLVSATGDWTRSTPQVEYPMIRGVYELYGAADKVANTHVDAEHNYNLQSRQAMYRFFGKWLLNRDDADTLTEGEIHVEKPEDLLVFGEDDLPADMVTPEVLVENLRRSARQAIDLLRPATDTRLRQLTEVVRLGLRHAVCSAFPEKDEIVITVPDNPDEPTVAFERAGRRVPARFLRRSDRGAARPRLTLWVHPEGIAAAPKLGELADRLGAAGHDVLLVEPFGTGANRPPADLERPRGSTDFFTTFNRTDAAETVFDLLTVLAAVLGERGREKVDLVGFGETGPLCLVARAMIPDALVEATKLCTVIDMKSFDAESDQIYLDRLFLPGIRRIGGLPAVSAVAANGPLYLHNADPRFNAAWAKDAGRLNRTTFAVWRAAASPDLLCEWLAAH